jgi:hypothetical protein
LATRPDPARAFASRVGPREGRDASIEAGERRAAV